MKADLKYYRKIFNDIDRKDIGSLYLFRGQEAFIMEEMADRICKILVSDDLKSFNLTIFYGSEIDTKSFIATARSFPFLAERRVLILKEMERLRGSWKAVLDYCRNPSLSSVVIIIFKTHDEMGRRNKPPGDFKSLESTVRSNGAVIQFDRLSHSELQRWVRLKAKRMGMDMDGKAAETLVRSVGANLFNIKNELDKLAMFFENRNITRGDLKTVIGSYRMDAIFDLINAIRPGNERETLRILSRIINTGAEGPSVVIYHLIRHFISLLKIKAGYGADDSRYDRLNQKADLFSTREILVWLENLRLTELAVKSISFPEEVLITGTFLHSMRGEFIEDAEDTSLSA